LLPVENAIHTRQPHYAAKVFPLAPG